ncbi:sprouty-related, EVH1 domain-containing protein 2-like [Haliotis cracherodii]|uniref:sprouty-related, EVH1 domain-containing protein 2-like n=1 Tax=Haliotis cracherodii TaxID=6455 RepID=UPI0039E89B67
MTEEQLKNGDYLVHVQAQVMTRDDSTGGWVPMGGGGLSNVGLRKLEYKFNGGGDSKNEYVIYGERIADNTVVLDCVLKKDIQYTKANPKFHHWKTDEQRFGLTFERYDDAKKFDRGIKRAVAELTEGSAGSMGNSMTGEEEVFQIVELPLSGGKDSSSQSASTTSTTTSSPAPRSPVSSPISGLPDSFPFPHPHANHHHLHLVHYMSGPNRTNKNASSPPSDKSSHKSDSFESSSGQDDVWIRPDDPTSLSGKSDTLLLDTDPNVEMSKEDSYVTFSKSKPGAPHEYSYPNLEPMPKPPTKRESTTSMKTQPLIIQHPPLPLNKKHKTRHKPGGTSGRLLNNRSRCKHCHEVFSLDDNQRGSCEDAPDGVEKFIECVTCVACSKCLIYHCMSDADGEYRHPCECDPRDDSNCKKWTALTILSLLVPCLWCYWPLTACHRCGIYCRCCGGRHKAV